MKPSSILMCFRDRGTGVVHRPFITEVLMQEMIDRELTNRLPEIPSAFEWGFLSGHKADGMTSDGRDFENGVSYP
jgi:hypothetical protein